MTRRRAPWWYATLVGYLVPAGLLLLPVGMLWRAMLCCAVGIALPLTSRDRFPTCLAVPGKRPRVGFFLAGGVLCGLFGATLVVVAGRYHWPGGAPGFLLGYVLLNSIVGSFVVFGYAIVWLIGRGA